jgi:hypothetical protein
MYHHHLTQKMLDAEWIDKSKVVIADLNAAKADKQNSSYIVYPIH